MTIKVVKQQFEEIGRRIDWDIFLDGQPRFLVVGTDVASIESARAAAFNASKRRERSCRARKDGTGIVIQFTTEQGNYEQPAEAPRSRGSNQGQRPKNTKADKSPPTASGKRRRKS